MDKIAVKYLRISLAAILISFSIFHLSPARAQSKFSDCLLNSSEFQHVSLGKPLAAERLGNNEKIKIGVIPFYFSDNMKYEISNEDKKDYYLAEKIIEKISNGIVDVEIIFLPKLESNLNSSQFKQIVKSTHEGWAERNLAKSTYGFVKNILLENDDLIDYSNLDSVILEGGNEDRSFSHAEAIGFFRSTEGNNFLDSGKEFFKSVKTKEGFINNAVLLDSHKGPNIIAHELFHNFGLTDLYGSGTGPGQFSMMASNASRLLNYEKAVLGWFPLQDIKCNFFSNEFNLNSASNIIEVNDIYRDSIFIFKKADDIAYIIEVSQVDGKPCLFVYYLEQNLRPPITLFGDPSKTYLSVFDLSDPKNIGFFYKAFEFNLLISNRNGNSATLRVIPSSLINTIEANKVIQESNSNREEVLRKLAIQKDTKIVAEIDTKATTEIKSKETAPKNKVTITCTKNKLVKKVSGINPKCPAGYKRK